MAMKKIWEGDHVKMLIEKGKETSGSKVKLIHEDGEPIKMERMLKAMIQTFWGDLFCMNLDAILGSKKILLMVV